MKVEIIERQTVKPSSPTPNLLRSLKLSCFDRITPPFCTRTLLFYPNITSSTSTITAMINERYCQHLVQSLAKTLTHFYPLAGRLSNGYDAIDCNDDGAEFAIARVQCSLSEVFGRPVPEMLARLLPAIDQPDDVDTRPPLLLVQANLLQCGGMAIRLRFSHKIVDGSTRSSFISFWATTCRALDDDADQVTLMLPKFGAASYFPPLDFSHSSQAPSANLSITKQECITKRFVFNASKIATLQSKLASLSSAHLPTRVLAASALIWKCAMEASSRSSSNSTVPLIRPSTFRLTVGLRKRIMPPLPENLAGNVVGHSIFKSSKADQESGIDLKYLVAKFRKGIEELKETYSVKPFDSNEEWQRVQEYMKLRTYDDMDHYNCTSWSSFPFYETDFGWGKPSWVSIASLEHKNLIVLIDQADCKGIEAWLSLSRDTMELFESNSELLTYATVNPSVT